MSHLRRFRTLSEYETFRNSDEWVTPNVSAINDIDAIMYNPYEKNNYLRFTAIEDSTLSLNNNGSNTPNVEYSFDGINDWTTWDYSKINLPAGKTVYMRGNNPDGFSGFKSIGLGYKYNNFGMTGKIESHGNIMSLLYGDDFKNKLTIPVDFCFSCLFYGCSSLTTAPELPATTLVNGCYYRMFQGCSSLTTAPDLPATTLAESCYQRMFYGCKSLNSITMLATDISALGCLGGWVNSVSSTGTFTKASSMTSLPSGESGIPEGWTVENA